MGQFLILDIYAFTIVLVVFIAGFLIGREYVYQKDNHFHRIIECFRKDPTLDYKILTGQITRDKNGNWIEQKEKKEEG